MDRRSFIKKAGFAGTAAAAATTLAAPAIAQSAPKVTWRMASSFPKSLDTIYGGAEVLSKMLSEATDGNFTIQPFAAGEIVPGLQAADATTAGTVESCHTVAYYYWGKNPAWALGSAVPFALNARGMNAWHYHGGGIDLFNEFLGKQGLFGLPGGNTGVQMGGWFRKEIKSLDDLKGLKMRIPSVAGEVFAKLGVNVTNIAPGELYTSLERGTIDALEWVGPGMDIKMGFHKIAPYYYAGWHEPATDLQFIVNKKAMDSLPPEYQAALKTAIQVAATDMHYENFAMSADAWAAMTTEVPNVKVMTFPEPVLQAMKKASDEVLADYAAKDPFFKEVLDSQNTFMKKARAWTKMSEQYYLQESEKVVK